MYINDIAGSLESSTRLIADDTSLLYSSDSIQIIANTITTDVYSAENWGKDPVNLVFIPVCNPSAQKLYIFRHCTNIVYIYFFKWILKYLKRRKKVIRSE